MGMEIMNRLAQLMRQPESQPAPNKKSVAELRKAPESKDTVSLSALAKQAGTEELSEFEKNHKMHFERVKELVRHDKYEMPESMVDEIAGRIATMLGA